MADTARFGGMHIVEVGERGAHSDMLNDGSCATDDIPLSSAHRQKRFVQPAQHSSKCLRAAATNDFSSVHRPPLAEQKGDARHLP